MPSATLAPAPIPTPPEHPDIQRYVREHGDLIAKRDAAQAERARLAADLAEIDSDAARLLVTFGKISQVEVDQRASAINAQIAALDTKLAGYERAIGQLEFDGRELRARVQAEIRQRLGQRALEVLAEMAKAFPALEEGYAELKTIAARGVPELPLPLLDLGVANIRKALSHQR